MAGGQTVTWQAEVLARPGRCCMTEHTDWLMQCQERACVRVRAYSGERPRARMCTFTCLASAQANAALKKKQKPRTLADQGDGKHAAAPLGPVVTTLLLMGGLSVNPLQARTHAQATGERERCVRGRKSGQPPGQRAETGIGFECF